MVYISDYVYSDELRSRRLKNPPLETLLERFEFY